jgi:hypothetical protein
MSRKTLKISYLVDIAWYYGLNNAIWNGVSGEVICVKLGKKDGVFMVELLAILEEEEISLSLPISLPPEGMHQQKPGREPPEGIELTGTLILDFRSCKTVRNKFV